MTVVEYFSAEKSVESGVAGEDAIGSDGRMEALSGTGLDDFFCSFFFIEFEVISWQSGSDAFEDVSVCVSVGHIISDIFNLPVSSIFFDMVVDPSN